MFIKFHDKEDGTVFLNLHYIVRVFDMDGDTTIETTEGFEHPTESVPEVMELIAESERRQCAR